MNKVLVTGGAGYVGSHLVERLLAENHQVYVYDNLSSGKLDNLKKHPKLLIEVTDLTENFTIPKDVDTIFHLAANPDIPKGMKDPTLDLKHTFLSTINLLQAMHEVGCNKIVYTSSCSVYGEPNPNITSVFEWDPCDPISFYGASKRASELYLKLFMELYKFKVWILRFGNVIGGRQWRGLIWDQIDFFKRKGYFRILGDGKQVRPWVYIDDVVSGILHVWHFAENGIYNLGTSDLLNVHTVVDMVEKKLVEHGLQPKGLTIERKYEDAWQGDIRNVKMSNSKLLTSGWIPKLSGKQAVNQTIEDLLKVFYK